MKAAEFKSRLRAREVLVGAFVKTPHPVLVEVLSASAFDFLVLDAEHAPFDRGAIDVAIMAGRAQECPVLVRMPNGDPSAMAGVLDSGAAGVMIPHVTSAGQARALVRAVRYGHGGRGFAGTTRAAGYGRRKLGEHLAHSADEVSLICQIEDPEALDRCHEIAATNGVDAVFVGRADLAVAYGCENFFDENIAAQCEAVLQSAGVATGLCCAPNEDFGRWKSVGATLFVVGSDHTLMQAGAAEISTRLRAPTTSD